MVGAIATAHEDNAIMLIVVIACAVCLLLALLRARPAARFYGFVGLLVIAEYVVSEVTVLLAPAEPPPNSALALATTFLVLPTVVAAVVARILPPTVNAAATAVASVCSYLVIAFAGMVVAVNAGYLYP